MQLALDHVLLAVDDLAAAAVEVERRYGLASVEGGRHPAWGTANRIVPLGDTYVELVTVVDRVTAATSGFGRWIASGRPRRPLAWAVRTNSLEATARRLGLTVTPGFRAIADGEVISWRSAGIDEAAAEPSLPFFIEWADRAHFPGRSAVAHLGGATKLGQVNLTGDQPGWHRGSVVMICQSPSRRAHLGSSASCLSRGPVNWTSSSEGL